MALHVNKYQITAKFQENTLVWGFAVETDDGRQHALPVKDGAEIPVLLQVVRADGSLDYDPQTRTLSTGWNSPGEGGARGG